MSDSLFTPALLLFGIAAGAFLGCLEWLWLRWPLNFAGAWPGLLLVALVNVIFIYLLAAIQNSYFLLFVFPIPVIPLAYLGLKRLAYLAAPRTAGSPVHSPWKVALLTLFFHTAIFLLAYAGFARINPTRSNLTEAIRNQNNVLLEVMLWMSVNEEPNMTILVNEAITDKNDDAVRRLIRHGADPRRDYWLGAASHETLWRIAKWMLDRGVKPEEFDRLSRSPRFTDIAVRYGKTELEYCVKKGFNPTKYPRVLHAALDEHPLRTRGTIQPNEVQALKDKVGFLLDHGVDVNGTDELYFTPIFTLVTIRLDLSPVLNLMIERGADVNARSVNKMYPQGGGELPVGLTPLMLAVFEGDFQYAVILVKGGADKRIKDEKGLTALDYARKVKADEAMMRLLQ